MTLIHFNFDNTCTSETKSAGDIGLIINEGRTLYFT